MICEQCSEELIYANKVFSYSSVGVKNYNLGCHRCGWTNYIREVQPFEVYKMERKQTSFEDLKNSPNKSGIGVLLNQPTDLEIARSNVRWGICTVALMILTLAFLAWLDYCETKKNPKIYTDPKTKCEYFEATKTPVYGTACFSIYVDESTPP